MGRVAWWSAAVITAHSRGWSIDRERVDASTSEGEPEEFHCCETGRRTNHCMANVAFRDRAQGYPHCT